MHNHFKFKQEKTTSFKKKKLIIKEIEKLDKKKTV